MAAMAKSPGLKMSLMDLHRLNEEYKRLAVRGKAEDLARMQEIEQVLKDNGQNSPKVRYPTQDQARLRSTGDKPPKTPFKNLDDYVTVPNTEEAAAAASRLGFKDAGDLMQLEQADLDDVLGDSSDDPFPSVANNLDEEGYFDKAPLKSKGKGRK